MILNKNQLVLFICQLGWLIHIHHDECHNNIYEFIKEINKDSDDDDNIDNDGQYYNKIRFTSYFKDDVGNNESISSFLVHIDDINSTIYLVIK